MLTSRSTQTNSCRTRKEKAGTAGRGVPPPRHPVEQPPLPGRVLGHEIGREEMAEEAEEQQVGLKGLTETLIGEIRNKSFIINKLVCF